MQQAVHCCFATALLSLAACSTSPPAGVALPPMAITADMEARASGMPVERATGWLPKPGLRFGPFATANLMSSQTQTTHASTAQFRRVTQFELLRTGRAQAQVVLSAQSRITMSDPSRWLPDVRVKGTSVRTLKAIQELARDVSDLEQFYESQVTLLDDSKSWRSGGAPQRRVSAAASCWVC